MTATKQMPKDQLPEGEVLCQYCPAKCCQYFALQIDKPETRDEFDFIRWYMIHGEISVFVEDDVWYLMVHNRCSHLQEDNRCGIYETRPQICRDYSTDNCEYENDACYDKLFETPEQLWEFAEAFLPPVPRSKQTALQLPVISSAG